MSQTNIAAFFDVDLSQQDVSNFSNQIREELSKILVSKNLGAKNLSRSDICSRSTELVKIFCNNQDNKNIAFIVDATHLPCEKSSNNIFQRYYFIVLNFSIEHFLYFN